ncbi:MAG TPA: HAMP domain-containing methyl-accepting chemotaxis protein [Quisquiliibacterium sp.]|nr:HAMP domain-containing methyl-accepting chemotaxis protein [Quisquiliibacterium sp.]
MSFESAPRVEDGRHAEEARPLAQRARRQMQLLALTPIVAGLVVCAAMFAGAQGESAEVLRRMLVVLAALAVAAGVAATIAGNRLHDAVRAPVTAMRRTVARLASGDFTARAQVAGTDELGWLAGELDRFLDDRVAMLERIARESEELNDSVIEIMQAVGTIAARKDLTLKVPVTENVTGAIADALNLLTDETRRVLGNVGSVSQDVAQATMAVKSQSDLALQAAAREQHEVELAARELAAAALALSTIAGRARDGNESAERAVATTGEAVRAVASTVQGVARSRALIRETEKRIKRLGERSQEVGLVVGLIQGIAERTGILALNASMRAAAAGEAGRDFAVVADEVKRLSESARESTAQIARLINAIQSETNDTVVAMNQAISQVVEISRLAEQAGEGMQRTQEQTESLAADVREIARTSSEQARVGSALQERARIIQEASGETARQLEQQAGETARLVKSARALLDEVSVFKVAER